jgi:predicted nucleic acid-binding protein
MTTYVDTSALYAVLDEDDEYHEPAEKVWRELVSQDEPLLCTNYILVETFALVQHRLGMRAVRTLQEDLLPLIAIEWIDAQSHHSSVMAMLTAERRGLSLVDCSSFEAMRRLGITVAFAFDFDFVEQGFSLTPSP